MPAAKLTAKDRERFALARARGEARAQDPSTIIDARYDATRDAITWDSAAGASSPFLGRSFQVLTRSRRRPWT